MSILGHYNNFFFAAHLLDIAMGFKTLRTILSSVTHNGKQVRGRRGRSASSVQQGSLQSQIYSFDQGSRAGPSEVTADQTHLGNDQQSQPLSVCLEEKERTSQLSKLQILFLTFFFYPSNLLSFLPGRRLNACSHPC